MVLSRSLGAWSRFAHPTVWSQESLKDGRRRVGRMVAGELAGWSQESWQDRCKRQAGVWQDCGRRDAGGRQAEARQMDRRVPCGGGGDPGKFSERDKSAHQTLFSVKIRLEGRVNRVANALREVGKRVAESFENSSTFAKRFH
jgi:hypothetical protein